MGRKWTRWDLQQSVPKFVSNVNVLNGRSKAYLVAFGLKKVIIKIIIVNYGMRLYKWKFFFHVSSCE